MAFSGVLASAVMACSGDGDAQSAQPDDTEQSKDGGGGTDAAPPVTAPETPLVPATGPFNLSDVSVLFPLPASLTDAAGIGLGTGGDGGALLPREHFDAIELFNEQNAGTDFPEIAYERFRIVGLRLDPCFPSLDLLQTNPGACKVQLRLIAQPLAAAAGAGVKDSALHLFYSITSAELDAVLAELQAIRGDRGFDAKKSLGVHPELAAEGLSGASFTRLRAAILAHTGAARLTRFTFMLGNELFSWQFGGFEVQGSARTAIEIASVEPEATGEDFRNKQQISSNFGPIEIFPRSPFSRAIEPLFGSPGGEGVVLTADPATIRGALQKALEIENPSGDLHADNVDCASCHTAGPLRARAERLGHSSEGLSRFRSDYSLALGNRDDSIGDPARLRAFGYFHGDPVFSQRLVNETAAVAAALNARFVGR